MPLIIRSISIEHMRRFRNVDLPLGQRLTLIAGRNGTAKSTLLGMLCQPFSFGMRARSNAKNQSIYTRNYHEVILQDHKTVSGKLFQSEFQEVFRLSERYDPFNEDDPYAWRLMLEDDTICDPRIRESGVLELMEKRAGKIRFVANPGTKSHETGEGNYPHPVIYLGLNRLAPLALCEKATFTAVGQRPRKGEAERVANLYREVLTIDEELEPQFADSHTKFKHESLALKTEDYDAETNSAGQDNLGQILTALLSFRRLKTDLSAKYRGGLLLIDEIDATLHHKAQDKLLQVLHREAQELDIQVVATTHSLPMLKTVMQSNMKTDSVVLHLEMGTMSGGYEKDDQKIRITGRQSTDIEDLENDFRERSPRRDKNKISVLVEDEVAKHFLRAILRSRIPLNIQRIGSAGSLIQMAQAPIPELDNVVFVVDGDKRGELPKVQKGKRILALPGDQMPEEILYLHFYRLTDDDPFFKDNQLTRRSLFTNHMNVPPAKEMV